MWSIVLLVKPSSSWKVHLSSGTFASQKLFSTSWGYSWEIMIKITANYYDVWKRYLPNKGKKYVIDLISSSRIFDILSLSMLKEAEESLIFIKVDRSQWNIKNSLSRYNSDRESLFRILFLTATTECCS